MDDKDLPGYTGVSNPASGRSILASPLLSPWFLLLLGFNFSLLIFWKLHSSETLLVKERLESLSLSQAKLIQSRFKDSLHELALLSRSSQIVDGWNQESFKQITAAVLADTPGVYAFEWVPLVSAAERAGFEQTAQDAGLDAFRITEPDSENRLRLATERRDYLPVRYSWPEQGDMSALGLDHGFWAERRRTAERARDTARPSITPRVPWVRDREVNWAVLAMSPVYRAGSPVQTLEQRRAALLGYIVAALNLTAIIDSATELQSPSGIDYSLYDNEDNNQFLAVHNSRLRDKAIDPSDQPLAVSSTGLHMVHQFDFAGRHYKLLAKPIPGFESAIRSTWPWIVMVFGLLLTGLLTALVKNSRSRNAWLTLAVQTRTQDLRQSTEELYQLNIELEQRVETRTEALSESEHFSRLLLNNLVEGVVACDAEGRLNLFNQTAREWHGVDATAIPPEKWANYYDLFEEDGETQLSVERLPLLRALHGEVVRDFKVCIKAKGQPIRLVVVNSGPLIDGQGNKKGAIATLHDITEKTAAQTTAVQIQKHFQGLFEFSPNAIMMVDHEGVIRKANRKSEELFGWSRSELEGQKVEILMPCESRGHHVDLRESFMKTLSPRAMGEKSSSQCAVRKDGTTLPVEISLGPIETEDRPMIAVAVQDITERVQQEEDRRALLVAERANAAKSAFLATMSHEIRTPMNGVIGCVDMLARSSLKPHQVDLVETMHDSSLALLTVIDDILDFSKIEAGQLELEREPVSLERVVESVCATMKQIALRKRLKIDVFTDPRLPHLILSDSVRLRQILNNLLSNAIKFTRDQRCGGRIMVRAEPAGESQMCITVVDNGIGISAEGLAKLFKPFMQTESSTTRRYGGTGLGLSICKRLVDMLGGRIKVDSQIGRGSTFTVTLPIEPVTDTSPPIGTDLSGLHCLVVVQDMAQARDWCVYLEHAGACSEPIAEREKAQLRLAQLPPETTVVIMEESIEAARQWLDGLAIDSKPMLVIADHDNEQKPYLLEAGIAKLNDDAMPRNALLQAIGIVTGRIQLQSTDASAEHLSNMLTPLDRELAIKQKRLILVAEDNEINQKMISRQLTLLGYAADVIDNGRDALYAWRKGCHALLLTDLHMPEMDGYDLTRAIRNEESGTERLPIIAITANALKEEANRCLAVGMDEYLSKPIVLDKLKASLEKWLPEADIDSPPVLADITAQSVETSDKKPLDTAVLAKLVGDDPTLIEEFLQDFRRSAEEAAMQISAALSANECEVARDVAHRLKSSSRAVGALILGECCEKMEHSTNADDELLHKEFERTLNDVITEIDKIKKLSCRTT